MRFLYNLKIFISTVQETNISTDIVYVAHYIVIKRAKPVLQMKARPGIQNVSNLLMIIQM